MRLFTTMTLIALAVMPAGASDLPDLGEAARTTVSELEEARVGREAMRQIRGERSYLDDPELAEYLNRLGGELVASSPSPYRRFEFFAVRDDTLNAFALPGGFIGVHTGLIAAARSESELAGVLAHEIAHVTQNHIARIVDAQKGSALTSLAALAVAILAARSDHGQLAEAAMVGAQAMTVQRQLDFTREHEKEADRIGLQTLSASGYDPTGMASFFERLQSQGRFYDNRAPSYLRTHPLTHERMADLQNRLSEMRYRQHPDSLDFQLVRARLQAEQGDAVATYRKLKADVRDDAVVRYGIAVAAFRAGETAEAARLAEQLVPELSSPLAVTLAARAHLRLDDYERATELLSAGMTRHAGYRPLAYAYADALLAAGKSEAARDFVTEHLRWWPDDAQLYERLAETEHAGGRFGASHLARAEAHIRLDQPALAMEQLQLARQAGGGDFYLQSRIDARLRELRERERNEAQR